VRPAANRLLFRVAAYWTPTARDRFNASELTRVFWQESVCFWLVLRLGRELLPELLLLRTGRPASIDAEITLSAPSVQSSLSESVQGRPSRSGRSPESGADRDDSSLNRTYDEAPNTKKRCRLCCHGLSLRKKTALQCPTQKSIRTRIVIHLDELKTVNFRALVQSLEPSMAGSEARSCGS
jgi:hypothetical protein